MFIIDRFEGIWAIIETEERSTFNLPRSVLPQDVKEGDVISIQVNLDSRATKERTEEIKHTLDTLFDQ